LGTLAGFRTDTSIAKTALQLACELLLPIKFHEHLANKSKLKNLMNSPLSFQDAFLVAPSAPNSELFLPPGNPFSLESFDFELFLPPGNPFSLESFDFELFLPPGNPFSLESIGFETPLLPVSTFLSDLSWSFLLENTQTQKTTSVEGSEFGDLFEIDVLTPSSNQLSPWLVLSTFGEDDELISPAEVEALGDQGLQWINLIAKRESPAEISMLGSDMAADPLLFIGVINDDVESGSLFVGFGESSAQNLLNTLGISSISGI
jgi:hypothetical protein